MEYLGLFLHSGLVHFFLEHVLLLLLMSEAYYSSFQSKFNLNYYIIIKGMKVPKKETTNLNCVRWNWNSGTLMHIMSILVGKNLCYQLQCIKGTPGAMYFLSQLHELSEWSKMQSVLSGNNSEICLKMHSWSQLKH